MPDPVAELAEPFAMSLPAVSKHLKVLQKAENTTMVAEGAELTMERVFDAPRELVWAVMTSPEHISQWYGPHGTTALVTEMDVRPGGGWRIGPAARDGEGIAFTGEFLEVAPPERFVRTSRPDVQPPGPPAVETVTLVETGGRTTMTYHARFPAEETLAFALSQGMTKGVLQQFDRLATLLGGPA